jgi:hypothetical protein
MKIDKKTYKVEEYNYYHTKHKKRQIILAGSLRLDHNHLIHLTNKKCGKSKQWNTFTITREGIVYQHFEPHGYSDFMSIKEVDKHSISIVLENMGMLFYDYESGKYLNWIHEEHNGNDPYEQIWNNSRYWEKYSDKQFFTTVELCKYLTKKYRIPLDSLGFNAFHKDTARFEGIVCRSNFDVSNNDLNPSFNFKEFLNEIGISDEE